MKFLILPVAMLLFWSCTSTPKEQPLEALDKKSAREVTLKTVQKGDSVLHITQQQIWFNGEKIATKSDTIITPNKVITWAGDAGDQALSLVPIYVTVQ